MKSEKRSRVADFRRKYDLHSCFRGGNAQYPIFLSVDGSSDINETVTAPAHTSPTDSLTRCRSFSRPSRGRTFWCAFARHWDWGNSRNRLNQRTRKAANRPRGERNRHQQYGNLAHSEGGGERPIKRQQGEENEKRKNAET